jgi:phage FluMu protein Com
MKAMKCPSCEEVSTFTFEWINQTTHFAPLKLDEDENLQIDYDSGRGFPDESEIDEDECRCNECNSVVLIEEIEILETEESEDSE